MELCQTVKVSEAKENRENKQMAVQAFHIQRETYKESEKSQRLGQSKRVTALMGGS